MTRWNPDDPRWLSVEPDIRLVDLQVLRQAGVPEPLLFLALREEKAGTAPGYRFGTVGPVGGRDLSFLDEVVEDPEQRPYVWDLPDDCI